MEYESILDAVAYHAIIKEPEYPDERLQAEILTAEMSNVPIHIQMNVSPKALMPTTPLLTQIPYEEQAAKGAGDTLSMKSFVTNDFDLGSPFA